MQGSWRVSNDLTGFSQSPACLLLSFCSNNLWRKRYRSSSGLIDWDKFYYLSPGFSGSFCFCSHGSLQLDWQTYVFAIIVINETWIRIWTNWINKLVYTYISTLSTFIPQADVASSKDTWKFWIILEFILPLTWCSELI